MSLSINIVRNSGPIDEYWVIPYQLPISVPLRKLIPNLIISHPKAQVHNLPSLRLRAHHSMLDTIVDHLNILQQLNQHFPLRTGIQRG